MLSKLCFTYYLKILYSKNYVYYYDTPDNCFKIVKKVDYSIQG